MQQTNVSPGTTLRLLATRTHADAATFDRTDDDAPKGDPYEVKRFPAVRGGVLLVGYDGRGDVMLELRIPARQFTARMVDRMRRWLREHDDTGVRLVP